MGKYIEKTQKTLSNCQQLSGPLYSLSALLSPLVRAPKRYNLRLSCSRLSRKLRWLQRQSSDHPLPAVGPAAKAAVGQVAAESPDSEVPARFGYCPGFVVVEGDGAGNARLRLNDAALVNPLPDNIHVLPIVGRCALYCCRRIQALLLVHPQPFDHPIQDSARLWDQLSLAELTLDLIFRDFDIVRPKVNALPYPVVSAVDDRFVVGCYDRLVRRVEVER